MHLWPVRQKICARGAISWGGREEEESRVRDIARHSLGNLGAKTSLKCHSLIFRPILCKSAIVIFRQQLKTFNFNIILLCLQCSLCKMHGPEKEKLSIL